MSKLKYEGRLTNQERARLQAVVTKGERPARDIRRAHVILLSDTGHSRSGICGLLTVSVVTVDRTRQRWENEGVEVAISDRSRSGRPRVLTPRDEAKVVALACTSAPAGARRWAHRALTEALHKRHMLSRRVSRETVRRILAHHDLKPWKKGRIGASPN